MSHVLHPDVHEAGLQDGCPGCLEGAQRPLTNLDARMIVALVAQVVERTMPRSEVEALAQTNVERALHAAGKLAEVCPSFLERYLLDRWNVEASIG